MLNQSKTCEKCAYWNKTNNDFGFCKRYPPQNPLTYRLNNCGEWKGKNQIWESRQSS